MLTTLSNREGSETLAVCRTEDMKCHEMRYPLDGDSKTVGATINSA